MTLEIHVMIYSEKYIQLSTHLIPLCIVSHDIYCFNILRTITLLYHMYIEYEIYHMAYNKMINRLTDHIFIKPTMSMWHDDDTSREIKRW